MNKSLYRIVFNRARGLLMAVAEDVCSAGKAFNTSRAPSAPLAVVANAIATVRPLSFAILLAMGSVSLAVQAQIVADPSAAGNQRPTVLNAANGVPLVNIQTPSAAGVSRNTYSQFDVGQQGAILNNARNSAQTQLGGWVQGNPWLAAGSARVILNEVNSSDPSRLRGYVEVAGARAQVVIANPAGISCDGCGFINANRATLTTGTPILNGGSLDGYRVQRGTVSVTGEGLDVSRTDYADIIARSVWANAGIWASTLKVTTGSNTVNAEHTHATAIAATSPASAYGLDVAHLGGMYAGKITLVGTESGVGVRNAGWIGASAGDVVVIADGRLENSGRIMASGAVRANTNGGIANTGTLYSKGGVAATSAKIANAQGGQITSENAIKLVAAEVDNRGGDVEALGDVTVDVGSGTVDNAGSLIRSGGTLAVRAGSLVNRATQGSNHGAEGQTINITADRIDNQSGAMRADTSLSLTGAGTVDNTGGLISSQQAVQLQDRDPTNKTQQVTNTGGTLTAGESLDVNSAGMSGDGSVLSGGDLNLALTEDFVNAGAFEAEGDADLHTTGRLTNRATMRAGQTLAVSAGEIDNAAGAQMSGATAQIDAAGTLTNRGLVDGHEAVVSAESVNNVGTGRIYGDHLAMAAGALSNDVENGAAAAIGARDRLDIGAQTVTNREHAVIFSAGDMAIGGVLHESRSATGSASKIENNSASIEALGNLTLAAANINNTNEHFSTAAQPQGDPPHIVEYQGDGSPNRYQPGDPDVYIYNDESNHLHTPEGNFERWTAYEYDRTTVATVIAESDPGKITAGGAMRIDAERVLNDKSHIIAGGKLTGNVASLINTEVAGEQTVTDVGKATSVWRHHRKGRDDTGSSSTRYAPPAVISDIRLTPTQYAGHTAPGGSGMHIDAVKAGGPSLVVRSRGADTTLPNNKLYAVNPDPAGRYVVETDPRFTNHRTWLSSDHMLTQLRMDPAKMHKRLGDGFYEQKLIREQVAQLTGRRFVEGYANDEAAYRALMANAVTYAKEWDLRPGVALSATQMAQLTSDIVWLVEREVMLPNGEATTAWAPQVYLRTKHGDIDGSGALISGQRIDLNLSGDLVNQGTVAGREVVSLTAENVKNLGGRISGGDVAVRAKTDLTNIAGMIDAASSLSATAGRDLTSVSSTRSNANEQGAVTNVSRVAGLYVTNPSGATLVASAGRDLTLAGAQIGNGSTDGQTFVAAGRDLDLNTVDTSSSQTVTWDSENWRKESLQQEVGSSIQTVGDLRVFAGRDLSARGASVTSEQGMLVATAGDDVSVTSSQTTRNVDEAHQHTGSSSWLSKKTITTRNTLAETTNQGTTFSGNVADVRADNDINVKGSNVVSMEGATLLAKRDVNIEAATDATTERHLREERKTGLFGSDGIGFTIGTQQQSRDNQDTRTSAAASTVGATNGNVTIGAGNHFTQIGSNVVAPQGGVEVEAKQVDILAALETSHTTEETQFKQSGLTATVTAPVIAAIQTAKQMKDAAGETSDPRMKALAGATTALAGKNVVDAVKADPKSGGGASLSITAGGTKSRSKTTEDGVQAAGSRVAAGGDVNVRARGAGADSTLTVQGGELKGGGDVTLKADGGVALLAAQNSDEMRRSSSSVSGGVGMAVSVNSKGASFGATANASGSRGKGGGTDVTWTNTHVSAGEKLTVEAGGDTTLRGAVASGKQVVAEVGGDLNIESLQDASRYDSKDQSLGGSVTVGNGFSVSANVSQQRMNSDFASVTEQSGFKAGDGGFQVDVKGNTDLKGGAITSTERAIADDVNRLTTATLTTSDIENHAEYRASSVGIGGGYSHSGGGTTSSDGGGNPTAGGVGTNQQGQATTGGDKVPGSDLPASGNWSATPPMAMAASGSGSSTTVSGISGGAIQITDEATQQMLTGEDAELTLASLNRDVTTEHDGTNALEPIFDEREIQAGFEIVGGLQREVGTFLAHRAQEAEAAKRAANDATLAPEQRAEAQAKAAELAKWGAGGSYRRVLSALTATAGGNVAGGAERFALDAAVNYVQGLTVSQVKQMADELRSETARAALHAVVGCAGAAASSQQCGAGATGAAASSLVGTLLGSSAGLTAQEKEAQLNLVTSLVVGVAGDSQHVATVANAAGTEGLYNRQLHPDERQWAKDNSKRFAAAYEEKTGRAITVEQAEKLLMGTGYMLVDDKAKVGPGYDMVAAQFISENSGSLFKATAAERADPGPLGGQLMPEQLALPGHEAHPEIGMVAGAGLGLVALGAIAPVTAITWGAGTAYDYAGDAISYRLGFTNNAPNVAKSLTVGGISGAAAPFVLPLTALGAGTAGKVVVGTYNALLSGTAAFGGAAVTNPGDPSLAGGVGAVSYVTGNLAKSWLPAPLGGLTNNFVQIFSSPVQAAIQRGGTQD